MEKRKLKSDSFQDVIFLTTVIIFTSVLVIGLYPGRIDAGLVDENFFITTLMVTPIIAAIYLIIISFRRNLNIESVDIRQSIKKKMIMSFVFIALLSAIPIVIISGNYFSSLFARMFSPKTMSALDRSVELSSAYYTDLGEEIRVELETISGIAGEFALQLSPAAYARIGVAYDQKGFGLAFIIPAGSGWKIVQNSLSQQSGYTERISDFYRSSAGVNAKIDRISVAGHDFVSGALSAHGIAIILWKEVPQYVKEQEALFIDGRNDYRLVERSKDYFESGAGSFLMIISILIIGIAYIFSLYISGNITSPILELSSAAQSVARGDYSQNLEKKSDDEIGALMDSFNTMAKQLDENRKVMYQKQRLEAWNEMAKKLVHEIKNPLTPISLSAGRMRKLTLEESQSRDKAVIEGTGTIIKEVNSLMRLVSEFNEFARLPERKPEQAHINRIVRETVALFSAYDNIVFKLDLDEDLPEISADRGLLRQALNNLITNAVRAIAESGTITLSSRFDSAAQEVVLVIHDTGSGIDEKNLERIFEPGWTSGENSTGLGLAIVEKIVLEHNGRIFCDSRKGEWTVFEIRLPVNSGVNDGGNTDS